MGNVAVGSSNARLVIITTLARYQTEFWLKIADHLSTRGIDTAFIAFDDESRELLENTNHLIYALSKKDLDYESRMNDQPIRYLESFGIKNINFWLGHEKAAFGLCNESTQINKLAACLRLSDRVITLLKNEYESLVMVQELGGFLSVIASYFSARHHKVDNWFVEPAFFRGRLFFLKNSFNAKKITVNPTIMISEDVRRYIEETLSSGALVIPKKDKHQYSKAIVKLLNINNFRRLVQKVVGKYLLGKHYEFGHLRHHVVTHIRMFINSVRLQKYYAKLSDLNNFVYYPFHVPGDMALTLRSPEYFDQLSLVQYVARNLRSGQRLVVKEHPAMMGAIDYSRLVELLRLNPAIKLMNPSTNNFEVLRACDAVVSVNSKSGAEAAMIGKQVYVLGDTFYSDAPVVKKLLSLQDLASELRSSDLSEAEDVLKASAIENYFENVWRQCYPGELYAVEADNCRAFTKSLVEVVFPE